MDVARTESRFDPLAAIAARMPPGHSFRRLAERPERHDAGLAAAMESTGVLAQVFSLAAKEIQVLDLRGPPDRAKLFGAFLRQKVERVVALAVLVAAKVGGREPILDGAAGVEGIAGGGDGGGFGLPGIGRNQDVERQDQLDPEAFVTGRLRAALDVVDADARALAVLDRIGDEIARDLAEAGPHRTIVIIQNVGRQTRRVEREASKAGVGAKAKEALLIIAAVATIFSAIPRQAAVATAPSQVHVHVEVQREDALAPGSYAYVSADNGLNVRIGDSVGEEVITTLPYGTKVQIIESDGPFSKIAFELADESRTRVGFAASEWLVLWADEDVPSGNPPPVPRD